MNESHDYEEIHVKCMCPNVVKKRKTKNEGYKHFQDAWAKMCLMKVVKFIKVEAMYLHGRRHNFLQLKLDNL